MKNLAIGAVVLALGVLGPQREMGGRFEAAWGLGLLVLLAFLSQQVANRLRLPPLVGWLAAGLLLGPSGLRIVQPATSGSLGLLHAFATLWVGFHIGLGLSWRPAHRNWRLPLGIGLSALVIFLLVASLLALVAHLPWALALFFGVLASLWGPFTAAIGVEKQGDVSLLAVLGSGFSLLLLSAVLAGLYWVEILPVLALRLAGLLWLSLLAGAGLAELLRRSRILMAPISSAVGTSGSFLLAALLVEHLQLYGLLFGFVAGFVLAWGEDPGSHLRHLLQAVHPLAALLFFSLMGATIDLRLLWPLLSGLALVLALQFLVLTLVRGLGALLGYPLLAGGAGPSSYSGWLLLAKGALLFELVYRTGDTLRRLLAPAPGHLLYQVALADILAHALLVWILAVALGRRRQPANPPPAPA